MRADEFKQRALEWGMKDTNGFLVGEIDGYTLWTRVLGRPEGTAFISCTVCASTKIEQRVIKDIRRMKLKKTNIQRYPSRNDAITLSFSGKGDAGFEDFLQALQLISDGLQRFKVQPSTTCAVCKNQDADAYAWYKNAYLPVHRACIEAHSEKVIDDYAERQESGSYGRGAVGAIIGAIVGMIPSLCLILFTEYIVAYLCALIPLASYKGYQLMRGKPTRAATWIIIACSMVSAFLLEISVWYAMLVSVFRVFPSVWDTILFYMTYFDGETLASLLQTLLFVALGIAICFQRINKTAKSEITGAAEVLDSIIDMPGQIGQGDAGGGGTW